MSEARAGWWKSFLLTVVVGLAGAEIVARRLEPAGGYITRREWEDVCGRRLRSGEDLRGKSFRWIGQAGNRREFAQDVYINAFGFHDREHDLTLRPRVQRILVVGDSFVEAYQVEMEAAFPRLLEDRLRVSGIDAEVFALGRSGWGPSEYRAATEEWTSRLAPDLVIACFSPANDIRNASSTASLLLEDQEKGPLGDLWRRPEPSMLPGLLIPASRLNVVFSRAMWRASAGRAAERWEFPYKIPIDFYVYADEALPFVEEGWTRTFAEFTTLHTTLAAAGKKFLVVSSTDVLRMVRRDDDSRRRLEGDYPEARARRWDFGRVERRLRTGLGERGIPYVDLQNAFRERFLREGKDYHFRSDGHWNDRGHDWAAALLLHVIRAMVAP